MFQNIGEMVILFWRTLQALPLTWRQRQKVFDQFFEIGNASLLMVCILSFFIGGVIALQTGPLLVERSLANARSEEHTSELQSQSNLVCRLLLEKKNKLMS